MEWMGFGGEPSKEAAPPARDSSQVYHHRQLPSSPCGCPMASLCQSRQHCVKSSIVSSWKLAEAQDQLGALGVHGSESLEQERARTQVCPTELNDTVEEWRRKESMLGGQEPSHSPVLGELSSWDVFDRSIINVQEPPADVDPDHCKTFLQRHEQQLRHLGMLRRWDDSQRFLSENPQLVCEETANYLMLWCTQLHSEGKAGLMEQVAHQAVVMQFILEMASSSQQDPRTCFRHFFHKAKEGHDVYLEVFHSELEAFKLRVKEHSVKSRTEEQNQNHRSDCREAAEPFSSLVAEFPPMRRCVEAGPWTNTGRWTKDEASEAEDIRMMETS
ncbi:hsp90 co-chaperone Cdc37-like 1 isoform 2-T2 [Pholidichthys leucotaenia]